MCVNTSACIRVQGGTGSGRTETACSSNEVSAAPLHTSCANQICLHDKQTAQWPKQSTCNIHSEPFVFIISMWNDSTTRIAHQKMKILNIVGGVVPPFHVYDGYGTASSGYDGLTCASSIVCVIICTSSWKSVTKTSHTNHIAVY